MILEDNPNRRPQTFGGVVYLAVLATMVVGLVLTALGPWRTGLTWLGSGLLLGAVSRLLHPEHARKWSDVLLLVVAGVGLLVLAVVVPEQRVR